MRTNHQTTVIKKRTGVAAPGIGVPAATTIDISVAGLMCQIGRRPPTWMPPPALKDFFSPEYVAKANYVMGFSVLANCLVLFCHGDIWNVGRDSLDYSFGSPALSASQTRAALIAEERQRKELADVAGK